LGQAGSKVSVPLFLLSKTKFEPLLLAQSDTQTIVKNGLEMRKLRPLKIKGVQKLKKNKPLIITKVDS
jgi:hypothetical protein